MELKDVYKIWDRFDNSDASLIELEIKGDHLKLIRGNADVEDRAVEISEKAVAKSKISDSKIESDSQAVAEAQTGTLVKAPLVGTFYAAPSPEEPPFVTVGKSVKKGDVVGIIEAMKLMNEVVAPVDGKVTKIEAKDGCMVEFNQTILVIE